jgi:DNA polymerase-3 subunit delta
MVSFSVMSKGTHCFDILFADSLPHDLTPVVVAFGDDAFLRRATIARLAALAKIDLQGAKVFDGEECLWRDVHDELATVSLFDPDERRVAVVKQGDDFVKSARAQLEKWCAAPVESSLLLLEISSFPANTKLFKIASEKGWCLDCSAPKGKGWGNPVDTKAVQGWIQKWGRQSHALQLTQAQAALVLDLVGSDCGLLDQELAKAALYAQDNGKIDDAALKQAIGSWRTQTVWEIIAAAVEGRTSTALEELHKVIHSGESPMAIAPQMSWSLRRYGTATHLIAQAERGQHKLSLRDALAQAGFRGPELQKAEQQLRRIGRVRGQAMLDWLLELDLKLKGSHSHEERGAFALEEFIVRLAGEAR